MTSRRSILLALVVALLGSLIVASSPAEATHGGPWHWAYRNPVVVDGTRHAATQQANKVAVENWNAIKANVQFLYRIDDNACNGGGRAPYHQVVVCYKDLDHEGGEAWVYGDGSDGPGYHITYANVYYNPEAKTRSTFSMNALACHELGHTLGFAHHTDPNEGCMHPATQRDRPGVHDAADLRTLYAHTDQYGPPQPGPTPTSPQPDPEPPRECLVQVGTTCFWYRPN